VVRHCRADEQALQKCRSAHQIISLQAKTHISSTTVAGQSSMDLIMEGLKTWSSIGFICHFRRRGAANMKASQWHQDVLYGPYLNRVD
jgi:hypothetical protein